MITEQSATTQVVFTERIVDDDEIWDERMTQTGENWDQADVDGVEAGQSKRETGHFGATKQLIMLTTLPHVCLLFLTICYVLGGAWFLTKLEPHQTAASIQKQVKNRQLNLWAESRKIAEKRGSTFEETDLKGPIDKYIEEMYEIYKNDPSKVMQMVENIEENRLVEEDEEESETLTLINRIFFVMTTLASIGYGKQAPDSLLGKAYLMMYVAVGIPLMIITLTDLGKFVTQAISDICLEVMKIRCRLHHKYKCWKKQRKRRRKLTHGDMLFEQVRIAGGDEEIAEFLWTHLENATIIQAPFFAVYGLLILFVGCTAIFLSVIEKWTVFEALYFLLISITTIGFGDVTPTDGYGQIIVGILLFIGLVLTSSCLDVLASYYLDRVHFVGRRLEKTDPMEWLREVQARRIRLMKQEAMRKLFETISAMSFMNFNAEMPVRFTAVIHSKNTTRAQELQAMFAQKAMSNDVEHISLGVTVPEIAPPKRVLPPPEPDEPRPNPPLNFHTTHTEATSIHLKWTCPEVDDDCGRVWFTLTYQPRSRTYRQTPQMIDFINAEEYVVTGLRSFTMYEFRLVTSTRTGSSDQVKTHDYTEPCTVPLNVHLDSCTAHEATISWDAPHKNKSHIPLYTVCVCQEPPPPYEHWTKYRVGSKNSYTLTNLRENTVYRACIIANHNSGLATISKYVQIYTPTGAIINASTKWKSMKRMDTYDSDAESLNS